MYTPRIFFENLIQSGELSDFLFDAFECHSSCSNIELDEVGHAMEIKKSVCDAILNHNANKAISHEMWAATVMISQFKRMADPTSRMPETLGENVYNHPAFIEALLNVRDYLSPAELKRA